MSGATPVAPRLPAAGAEAGAPAAPVDRPAQSTRARSKPQARPPRRRSREFALQGLYGWLVGRGDPAQLDAHVRTLENFDRCDSAFYDALLHGCIAQAEVLDAALLRHIDRKLAHLSPVEHAVLMIGAFELTHGIDVPYRVVINEGVELAKSFGGTDGHKYVNGVLDKIAADLRPLEVAARRAARAA